VVIRLYTGPGLFTPWNPFLSQPASLRWLKLATKRNCWPSSWPRASKKPVPIIAGILLATLVNHGLAGALGAWITATISPDVLRWILGVSFIAMAAWTLIPDKIEDEETQVAQKLGVFGATLVTFFLAEMGDKTQIATVAMAAHYPDPMLVVAGTTLGMLIADVPAVFVGDKLAGKIPMKLVHSIAAGMFAVLGVATLLGAGARWGM